MMFKRGLETLDEEYSDDSNDIVDAWINRHFQLGGDTGAVIAPGPGKHSTLGCLSDPDCFTIHRQTVNTPVPPPTVVPVTVRRVRGIDNLGALSE